MRRFLFVVLCWLALPLTVLAQASPAQLCVANMHLGAGSDTAGRDLLMKFLAKEKDKSVATAVPIDASDPEPAMTAAKGKNCDYLVTTDLTETHTDSDYWGNGPGAVKSSIIYVTVSYRLTKVSDGAEVTSGVSKASDRGSEQNAVGFAMHKIADKVTEAIKKAGPVSK